MWVVEIESRNVKALYRRTQAELDIEKALEIDSDNRDMKLEYKQLNEKVKLMYNNKDAQFYGNIFAKMTKLEHIEDNDIRTYYLPLAMIPTFAYGKLKLQSNWELTLIMAVTFNIVNSASGLQKLDDYLSFHVQVLPCLLREKIELTYPSNSTPPTI